MKTPDFILFSLTIASVVGAIEALVVTVLWNYVLCAIFTTIPTISFWLEWGIFLILNVISSFFRSSSK